jgi:3-deoxy-D-manno-octulosonic-acid transferase
MLAEMSLFAVQTEAEAQRFLNLGARADTVEVTGSIKFDLTIDPQLLLRATELRAQWQAQERPVWIAASTHEGEDEVVLAAHRQLLANHPDALLILVPRHPERFNSVFALCQQQGFATVRRSSGEPVTANAVSLCLGGQRVCRRQPGAERRA